MGVSFYESVIRNLPGADLLFPPSTSTMADYFGVELPHPFDKEYVDPASARTIARILQEDVTGK